MRPHEIDLRKPLADHPLNDGCRGFWLPVPQLHGGGRLWDLSGNGNHGTLTNGPTWTAGPNGFGAVAFDGTDDYIPVATPAGLSGSGSISLACWFRYASGGFQTAFGGRNTSGGAPGAFYLQHRAAVGVGIGLAIRNTASTETVLTDTATHNVAGRYLVSLSYNVADGLVTGYVNGRSIGSGVMSGTREPAASMLLGAGEFNGLIVDYGIPNVYVAAGWSRVLAAGEHATFYDQAARGFPDLLRRVRKWVAVSDGGAAATAYPHYYYATMAG